MEKLGRNSFHSLLFFFLAYYFFINRVVVTRMYALFGSKCFYGIVLMNLILPLLVFLEKPLNYIRRATLTLVSQKSYSMTILFLFKIMLTFYLLFTSVLTLQITSSVIITFYYNIFSLILLITFMLICVFYASRKGLITLNALTIFWIIFFIVIYAFYVFTKPEIRLFNYINIKSNFVDIVKMIIYLSFFLFEFVLLFSVSDNITTKIKKKHLLLFICFFSLISIYEASLLTGIFGNMLKILPFPFYESWKLAGLPRSNENIGYMTFLYAFFLCFNRLSFCLYIFNKMWSNTSKIVTFSFLALTGFLSYIMSKHYNILLYMIDSLFYCSLLLSIVCSMLLWIIIRKGRRREREGFNKSIA